LASWPTRTGLGDPAEARGLLVLAPDSGTAVGLGPEERAACVRMAARTLAAAGVTAADRVVVALSSDGEPAGVLVARAAAEVAEAAAACGPRGRMRLHQALARVAATTLVITPTGAMDLLARLHLEFLVDPLDLGLRTLVLTGEIASPGCAAHLAAEFGARVVEVYTDPVFGMPLAWGDAPGEPLAPVAEGVLGLAPLDADRSLAAPYEPGLAEYVLTPEWHGGLAGSVIRTGQAVRLAGGEKGPPAPVHTVGDHVLVRGRWLPLPRMERALARVDGITHWELALARPGTLDTAVLRVTFGRETLVGNPMWRGRIAQALAEVTPVRIEVEVAPEPFPSPRPPVVTDGRGQHLGRDRAAVAREAG
jgi:phenylacetate-CoA ligase